MTTAVNDTIRAQDRYVEELDEKGFDYSLVVGEAFVRGMRDIGYKDTTTALAELVDNSIEAGAENVHIAFGYEGTDSDKKPEQIAVMDDGHGMSPGMIRAAVLWGGSHRIDSREMFGRYGFGLPSACVSQGRQFTVFSRKSPGDWYSVSIDLDAIAQGAYQAEDGRICAPEAEPAELPDWLSGEVEDRLGDPDAHGTIVVIDKLDKVSWVTASTLKRHLCENHGVVYRKLLRETKIRIDDVDLEPVDPLFLNPSARFYDENEIRAEEIRDEDVVPVKDRESGEVIGNARVRYSYMPPGFQNEGGTMSGKTNSRFEIMKANNGILVLRAGRQIDVVSSKCPWTTFVNYDRNWAVEIDFDPTLDEEFSITTSKQQVVLTDRMWDLLEKHGVYRTIEHLRKRYKEERLKKQQQVEDASEDEARPSEEIMKETEKFKTRERQPRPEETARREKAKREEIKRRAETTGKPEAEVAEEVEEEIEARPWKVEFEDLPGAPFYRMEALGSQVRLNINRRHRFFGEVYMGPDSTPRLRTSLELMLFVLSECELDANLDRQIFYESERQEWSKRLNTVLQKLDEVDSSLDAESAALEADQSGLMSDGQAAE